MSRKSIANNTVLFMGEANGTVTRQYALTWTNVYKIGKFLRHASLSADYMWNNQSEFIVSVRAYPVSVLLWFYDTLAQAYAVGTVDIAIGPFSTSEVDAKGFALGYIGSNGARNLPDQKNIVKLCTITIPHVYNNFMDYAISKYSLYLPFVGYVTLDNYKYVNQEFSVYCSIDFQNGDIIYWLCKGNATVGQTIGDLIDSYEAHVGIDISLSQSNANENMRNSYLGAWKMVGDIFNSIVDMYTSPFGIKGIKSSVSGGIENTSAIFRAKEKHISKASAGSGRNKLIGPTSVVLVCDLANPVAVSSAWESINGYPLQETRTLSALTGYTEVGEIHFNPSGADIYNDEINEIVTLLQAGVIL